MFEFMPLGLDTTPGATIQNEALAEMRGLCCFWGVHILSTPGAPTEQAGEPPERSIPVAKSRLQRFMQNYG